MGFFFLRKQKEKDPQKLNKKVNNFCFDNFFLKKGANMQGDFEANSNRIVHVLCNTCNHIIFPKGISVKTLYKNHNGIFLSKHQQIK